jgi:antitoxin component YwqK of YwqJK toxin-antitoxin module
MMSAATLFAQQQEARYTTYLDELFRECKKKDAAYVRNLYAINDSLLKADVRTLTGIKKMDGTFIHRQTKIVEHGLFVFYFPNGTIESEGIYEYGFKSGAWKRFEANGSQKPDRYYKPESGDLLRALEK